MSETAAPRTAAVDDYIKAIYAVYERGEGPASTTALAKRLGVGASSVSGMLRKLTDQGLVEHRPYGGVRLTDDGTRAALDVLRRHRLLETYLVRELGYGWDEVHDEAEVLEHAVSDRMIDRIDAKLGFPERDPHGDPIPSADGSVPTPPARQLSDYQDGESGRVARISDADPAMLRYFDSVGIALDTDITVIERRDFAGTVSIRLGTDPATGNVDLGNPAAQAIWLV